MKLREQMLNITALFDRNNNRFLNSVAEGLVKSVAAINPDLKLIQSSRSITKTQISLTLRGQTNVEDLEKLKGDVDDLMNKLKNENELLNRVS